MDHADGTLELLSDGPLERVLARLQQEEGRPVGLAGPPEPLLGLGSQGEGQVEMVEALLRQFAGVQEPAPSGTVDLVDK